MRVIIQNDYQKMSQWAANHVIERINEFKPALFAIKTNLLSYKSFFFHIK